MDLPHPLQALNGAFWVQEHLSGKQDPHVPTLGGGEFYAEKTEPQKGCVTGMRGGGKKEPLARGNGVTVAGSSL